MLSPKLLVSAIYVLLPILLILPVGWQPAIPTVQAAVPIEQFTLGTSAQDRPITVLQIGKGKRKLVIVGNTHGGPEANTYDLMLQLIAHFRAYPEEVPETVRVSFIPTINPDGLALDSRFDSVGVDLNRNMNTNLDTCTENDWTPTVYGAYGIVSDTGGPFADSQVENRLLQAFLLDASGAIFLHSNAGLVFPAFCEHAPSIAMAEVYAEAADYAYNRFWPNYMINGGMHDWAGSMGIAAITPELVSPTESEFDQNLAGIQAVMQQYQHTLPLPTDRVEAGIPMPAVLWRYWRARGGEAVFGLPLGPAIEQDTSIVQTFTNARLHLDWSQADPTRLVTPQPLGRQWIERHHPTLERTQALSNTEGLPLYQARPFRYEETPLFFAETGHTLRGSFLTYWRRHGDAAVFGLPISEEFVHVTADGVPRTVHYFEHAVMAYYPEDGSVRLEPLGWQTLFLERLHATTVGPQVR
ncbi:MAG: peptidase M14 [Chloroflexaceae bacterium]|nr:peptidase M14 [Chloroflexaceae bacterium]